MKIRSHMYSTVGLLLILLISMLFTSCSNVVPKEVAEPKLKIIATNFPPYDFSRAVAGNVAEVKMLLPPASESHSFEPTSQDILEIQNSDIFIYTGGESDQWITTILESLDTGNTTIITLMDCVSVVEEKIVEGMQVDDHGHDHEAETEHYEEHADEAVHALEREHAEKTKGYDEHIWTSPRNAKLIVQKISDTLCKADPTNAEVYAQNAMEYLAKLDVLDSQFQDVVDNAVRKTVVFGDRFPFRYLADAYGLEYFAAFPGCSADSEINASTVKFLIDKINAENIPVVFHIELGTVKIANTIAESTNAKVMLLHSCHNITKADFEAKKTYIDLMTNNIATLKEALQ